jgi:hypothetical protein
MMRNTSWMKDGGPSYPLFHLIVIVRTDWHTGTMKKSYGENHWTHSTVRWRIPPTLRGHFDLQILIFIQIKTIKMLVTIWADATPWVKKVPSHYHFLYFFLSTFSCWTLTLNF